MRHRMILIWGMSVKKEYMNTHDLCIAWNWAPDGDFVRIVENTCELKGLSLLTLTNENIETMLPLLNNKQMTFRVFFDRASDSNKRFINVDLWAFNHGVYRINTRERAFDSCDKIALHYKLINAGIYTPHTIIIPPYEKQPTLTDIDLKPLGEQFIIKPAHGGGGDGVKKEVLSITQVLIARQEYPADSYLLQAIIKSVELGLRKAWFRVLYCYGEVYPCWWNQQTHIYTPVTSEEEHLFGLQPLKSICSKISAICNLELFSTEIALTADACFVVVDYVNDQIDLRLQSKTIDGVPDTILHSMAKHLVDSAV